MGRRPAQRRGVGVFNAFGRVAFEGFRQPEVEHFHRTVFGDHDIRRFQVAVDDAFCVRRVEPCRNLRGNVDRLFELESTSLDPLCQRFAFDELHDEREHAVGFFESIDRGNVGMIQRCQHASLALESSHPLTVASETLGKNFNRNVALQFGIPRAVNLTHAAASELAQDFVVGEGLSDHEELAIESERSLVAPKSKGQGQAHLAHPVTSRPLPTKMIRGNTRRPPGWSKLTVTAA